MLTIEIDRAGELHEFTVSCAEKLMDAKTDRGKGLVEFVRFVRAGMVCDRCED